MQRTRFLLMCLTVSVCVACGGSSSASRVAESGTGRGSVTRPLAELVPPGASWVIALRPAEIWAEPALQQVASALVTDEQIETWRSRTGEDLRALSELVLARFDDGWIVLRRGPIEADAIVERAAERMVRVEVAEDAPFRRRGGQYVNHSREIAALGSDVVVEAPLGMPAFATLLHNARAPNAPSAFSAAAGGALYTDHMREPCVAYSLKPLGLPTSTGAGLLLAEETGLAAYARALGQDTVGLYADLRGEFPPGAEANFQHLFRAVAASDLGDLFGLRSVEPRFAANGNQRVVGEVGLSAEQLSRGLRLSALAELPEVFSNP